MNWHYVCGEWAQVQLSLAIIGAGAAGELGLMRQLQRRTKKSAPNHITQTPAFDFLLLEQYHLADSFIDKAEVCLLSHVFLTKTLAKPLGESQKKCKLNQGLNNEIVFTNERRRIIFT